VPKRGRYSGASILLVLGLTLSASGGQTEARAELATILPEESVDSTSDFELVADPMSPAPSVSDAISFSDSDSGGAEPVATTLSPLASQTTQLSSAFPEVVLDGLGDAIGRPPTTLSLPDLGVDSAQVLAVGLESNGELEVPGVEQVGWYQFGAGVDGGRGSAVLAAHIAYNGRNGVFRYLADSEIGDEIVIDRNGQAVQYRVTAVQQFNKFELPIDDLFSENSEERLVLITCGGQFNPSVGSYDDNMVVIATPV